ncbi:MAG: phytoene desaturase family protein [Gaiellales bacterium]
MQPWRSVRGGRLRRRARRFGDHDAIVVGGGHNGLVAAFYLARAGIRTLVFERRRIVGGACVTEEFAPGYRASPGAYVLSALRPAVWRDMRLRERGLKLSPAGPSLNLFADGTSFMLRNSDSETAREISAHSSSDARTFLEFKQEMAEMGALLFPTMDAPPGAVRIGLRAARRRGVAERAAELLTTSARRYLDSRFESEHIKAALGWDAISNTLAGPSDSGTGVALLHEHAADPTGAVPWGFVAGGMGEVTRMMSDAAREEGAEIRTGAEVARVVVDGGRARGVELADGASHRAAVVVSNADPKRTFLTLCDPADLPDRFLGAIRAYRCQGASLKLNLALAGLPALKGRTSPGEEHRGLIQVTLPLEQMDRQQEDARRGISAVDPHLEVCFPTVHDASLAPQGGHVVTVGVRSQPYALAGEGWDVMRDRVADRVVEQLGRFFPDLPGMVVAREVLSPLDLERRLALTGGHHLHGDMLPDQLFLLRPVQGHAGYRSPVRGLYMCGAGTHPGGGVTGANGRNCARVVVGDLRRGRMRGSTHG